MHTHSLRKILGANFLLAVFSTTLLIGVASALVSTTPAHALDSLGGNATWVAPNVILYTDGHNPAHKILLYQQGKDAKGGDDTMFVGESVAKYLTYNKDNEICDSGDYASANNSYSYPIGPGDAKLKSDTNPALWGHVTGITQNPDTLHIDQGSGYARFGGCGDNGGGDAKFTNKRPDGTIPQATIGNVKWTSPYTLAVDSTITAPKNPSDQSWDTSGNPPRDSWVESTIPVGREYDQDSKENGGSMSFTSVPPLPSNAPQGCDLTERITIPYMDFLVPPASYKYAQVYIPHVVNSNGAFCESDPLAGWVKIVNDRPSPPPIDKSVTAAWVDTKTLQITGSLTNQDGSSILDSGTTFTQSSVNGNEMVLSNKPACGSTNDTLDVNPYKLAPYAALAVSGYSTNQRCTQLVNINIAITNAYPEGGVDNTGGNQGNPDNGGNFTDNCPIKGDGDWLFCMIAGVTSGAIDKLSGGLQTLLYTPVDQIFTDQMQNAFNSFRNIGVALLVIVGLFMVLSQAAGLEIFAAYTVRKALPRLVLAMIGISLAWPILQFVVTFFNDIGVWIMQIILTATAVKPVGAPLDSFNVGSGIALATVAGGALLFSTGIVMSLLGTLLLALLVGFIVLAIRQMVILVAILLAPLAIAASILPSTQKIWSFWRESLLTSLAMFPIIMAFLGAGKAMSDIAGAAAEGTPDAGRSFTWKLLSVFCLIAALAALPFAFRIAGGIVSTAHSLVSGGKLGKGAFGALSAYRSNKLKQRGHDLKEGNFFRQGGMLSRVPFAGRGIDRLAAKSSNFLKGAYDVSRDPFNGGRRRSAAAANEHAMLMKALSEDPEIGMIKANEDYWEAGTHGNGTEADVRSYLMKKNYKGKDLNDAVGAVMNVKRKYGQRNFEAMAAVGMAGTGTGLVKTDAAGNIIRDENGNAIGDINAMDQRIALAAHGNKVLAAQLLASARGAASQAGRIDLAGGGFAKNFGEIVKVMDAHAKGQHYDVDATDLLLDAFRSTDAVSIGRARANGLAAITDAVQDRINTLHAKPDADISPEERQEMGRLVAALENARRSSLMYAAPQRVEVLAKGNRQIDVPQYQVRQEVAANPIQRSPTGQIVPDPDNLRQVTGYNEIANTGMGNPYDPNLPPTP